MSKSRKTTEHPFPGIKLTRDSRGGASSERLCLPSDYAERPYPPEILKLISDFREGEDAWIDEAIKFAKECKNKAMKTAHPPTLEEYIRHPENAPLSDETMQARLGLLVDEMMNPDIERTRAIRAAMKFSRVMVIMALMSISEDQGAGGAYAANKIRDAKVAFRLAAIRKLVAKYPKLTTAGALLIHLPECKDENGPALSNVGDFTIWRVKIEQADDGGEEEKTEWTLHFYSSDSEYDVFNGRTHCGGKTFGNDVKAIRAE